MPQELKVIADFYDFMLWLIRHTEKFPRHHRYSLDLAMERHNATVMGTSTSRVRATTKNAITNAPNAITPCATGLSILSSRINDHLMVRATGTMTAPTSRTGSSLAAVFSARIRLQLIIRPVVPSEKQ